MYQLVSSTGWVSGSSNLTDAKALAEQYVRQWYGIGIDSEVVVTHFGHVVYLFSAAKLRLELETHPQPESGGQHGGTCGHLRE